MTLNQKVTGTTSTIPSGLLKGTMIGILVTVVGAAIMSGLIIREILRENAIGYCAMIVLVSASFADALVAMKKVKEKLAVVSILSGAILYLVLMGANALFSKGIYEGMGVTALLILAGTGTALLLGLNPSKRTHSRLRKNRRR